MKLLVIDFETKDPYITRKLGAGWAFGYNVTNHDFKVLGAALKTHDNKIYYETNLNNILDVVKNHDTLLAHNASYELGCLHFLLKHCNRKDIDLKSYKILDTKLLFKLHNSALLSYTLDSLAKKYLKIDK